MAAPHYEIGVVYKKNSRLYLAVNDRELISFKHGKLQEVRPYVKYDVVRQISVTDLCKRWGIHPDRLDEATSRFLSPSEEGIKARPRALRQNRANIDHSWKVHSIRLAS